MHVHFTQRSKSVALKLVAASLFGKALLCAVSVVMVSHVQDGVATSCVQREVSVFMAMSGRF